MEVPRRAIDEITAIYEAGRYLSAWERAKAFGPLKEWSPAPARVIAGRLAMNLGGERLGLFLHLRARRADRSDPEVHYFLCFEDKDLDGAQRALAASAEAPGDDSRRAQWIRLHVARGHKSSALELLQGWLADPGLDPGWLEPALQEMAKATWQDAVDAAMEHAVAASSSHPALGRTWIAPLAARDKFDACRERLRRLEGTEAQLVPALTLYLEAAGRARLRTPLERALKDYRSLIDRPGEPLGDGRLRASRAGRQRARAALAVRLGAARGSAAVDAVQPRAGARSRARLGGGARRQPSRTRAAARQHHERPRRVALG